LTKKEYDKTYGSLSDAVYIHTLDKIKWCNRSGARLLGYDKPEEIIGKSPFEFATDENYLDILLDAGTSIKTREGSGGHTTLNRRDGKEVAVLIRCALNGKTLVTVVRPVVNPTLDRKTLRFIEGIRNEVKTPLAVIKGYTELMERMELDGAQLTHFLLLMRENIDLLEATAEKIRTMEGIEENLAWTVNTPLTL